MADKRVQAPVLSPPAKLAPTARLGSRGVLGNPHLVEFGGFEDSPLSGAMLAMIDLATVSTPFLRAPAEVQTFVPVELGGGGGETGEGAGVGPGEGGGGGEGGEGPGVGGGAPF